jgi:hypothetical protein
MRTSGSRRTRRGLSALMAVVAFMAIAPTVASATHVFGRSFATCERQDPSTGTFDCTVTIVIGDGTFSGGSVVRVDDDPAIGVRPIGATFATVPTRTGGTCAPTSTVPFSMPTAVALQLTDDLLDGCTIVLDETLTAQPEEICHSFTAIAANSVAQTAACVVLLPALTEPVLKADCKNGGWRNYPHLGFKNQGECVSFVARRHPRPCRAFGRGELVGVGRPPVAHPSYRAATSAGTAANQFGLP